MQLIVIYSHYVWFFVNIKERLFIIFFIFSGVQQIADTLRIFL